MKKTVKRKHNKIYEKMSFFAFEQDRKQWSGKNMIEKKTRDRKLSEEKKN